MPRIADRFERLKKEGRPGLVAYLTAGDPTPQRSAELVFALERGGADIIELGVPFSDPIADGPVIQRASERALLAGTTLAGVLDIARAVRAKSQVPLVLFSYLNPLMRYGFDRLAADAVVAGIDGVLLTDLSVEEAAEPVASLRKAGLDTIFLAAPTSTERRLKLIAKHSSGFIYVVSRTGITGEKDSVSQSVIPLVSALQGLSSLPLAVGFGISKPEHFAEVGKIADAVVVGSAFVRVVEEHKDDPKLAERLENFVRSLTGRTAAVLP